VSSLGQPRNNGTPLVLAAMRTVDVVQPHPRFKNPRREMAEPVPDPRFQPLL
jgi:hypothetical protein